MESRGLARKAIAQISGLKDGWVSVESVASSRRRLDLALVVRRGGRGRVLARWMFRCVGVREVKLSDIDGGGLRLYSRDHPVVRQYTDRRASLRLSTGTDHAEALGVLYEAHVAAVDDWIPFDRYCPASARKGVALVLRGPAFLLRRYAAALRRVGHRPAVVVRPKSVRSENPQALHFGSSYVVAARFVATEVSLAML
jgi:hypothetical protein